MRAAILGTLIANFRSFTCMVINCISLVGDESTRSALVFLIVFADIKNKSQRSSFYFIKFLNSFHPIFCQEQVEEN